MIRWYLCEIVGDGSDAEPFRPVFADLVSVNWSGVDGRADSTAGTGAMLVQANVSAADHSTLVADARIEFLPFMDNGNDIGLDTPISQMRAPVRSALAARLEVLHIPTDDWTGATTVREVLRRIVRRFLLRQLLGSDDWSEALDLTVADIPVAKRQRIAARLEAFGFDLSQVTGETTVRQIIRGIGAQSNRLLRGMVD